MNRIKKQQATFFGHIMKGEGMEYLITAGTIEGIQGR